AHQLGIEREGARRLFALQIERAREIQQRVASDPEHPAEPLRDLNADLRPALDRIGRELLIAIHLAMPELERADFASTYGRLAARFERTGVDASAAQALLE